MPNDTPTPKDTEQAYREAFDLGPYGPDDYDDAEDTLWRAWLAAAVVVLLLLALFGGLMVVQP